jgi:hypothetical protein
VLHCTNNQLVSLPELNVGLKALDYFNNPIYEITK